MITYQCPKCDHPMSAPDAVAGQKETCPACRNVSIVPSPSAEVNPVAESADPTATTVVMAQPGYGSTVVWHGVPSWKGHLRRYILCVVVLAICIAWAVVWTGSDRDLPALAVVGPMFLPIVIMAVSEIVRRFTRYTVTDQVVSLKTGILSRHVQELPVSQLRQMRIAQSLLDRVLMVGNISFATSATGDIEMTWRGVKHPNDVRDLVRQYMD